VGTVELEASHEDTCYQAFLSTGPLALLPLADKALCSIVWSLDNDIWENLMSASDDDFVAQINRALGPNCPEVLAVGPRAAFPLHQCHAVDYIARRVALVGDAAHAIHPLAGQGINLGLKDVAALTAELEQAWSSAMDVGSSEALKRFQRVRKTDNLAMMAAMEGFKRGFGSVNPAVRVLRNLGLNWVNQAGWLRDWFARQAVS
jgi:2-octaprenylphenol hydroxylase